MRRLPVAAWGLPAIVLLGGALLRFAHLSAKSLWLDEIMAAIASGLGATFSIHYARGDVTPPLHYLLMVPFARSGWPEFWLRVPSALSGVLSILALYLWLARRGERRAAGWAACLFSLHPFALYHAQDARMYSHMMLLSILSMMALEEALRAPRGGPRAAWCTGLAAALALALYNSYFAAFQLLSLGLYLGYRLAAEKDLRDPRRALPALFALLLPVALFLPWLSSLEGNQVLGLALSGLHPGHALRVLWAMLLEFGAVYAGCVFWPLVGYGIYLADRPTRALGAALLAAPLGFLLVYDPRGHFFAARYLAYLFPFAAAAAGRSLAEVEARLERLSWPAAARTGALAAAILLTFLVPLWSYERGEKQNWQEAAAILAAGMQPGDLLLTGKNDARIAVDYYLARKGESPFTDGVLALAMHQPRGLFPLRDGAGINKKIALNPNVRETWQLEAVEELVRKSPETGSVWWVSAHPDLYTAGFYAHLEHRWERVAILPALERWGEIRIYRLRK